MKNTNVRRAVKRAPTATGEWLNARAAAAGSAGNSTLRSVNGPPLMEISVAVRTTSATTTAMTGVGRRAASPADDA